MSNPKWTEEQNAVINSRNGNLLVAAAAGSGKTAVLVERIIKLITDDTHPIDINRLLIVTFTKAAASEMKERVQLAIEKLIEISSSTDLLKKQLTLLDDAQITTIHSFCLNVIENYYYKIPLEPGFRVASEEECTLLKIKALDSVFQELYEKEDSDFYNALRVYGNNRGDDSLREIILQLYNFVVSSPDPIEWLNKSASNLEVDKNFDFLNTDYGKNLMETVTIILEGIEQSMDQIVTQTHGIPELQSYYIRYVNESSQIKNIRKEIMNGWEGIKSAFESINYENYQRGMKKIPSTSDAYIKELKNSTKSLRDECKEQLNKLYDNIFYRSIEDIQKEFQTLYPTIKTISRICKDFISYYNKLKKEANIIDFTDIEHYTLNILTTKDKEGNIIPSEIAREYSNVFDEIFIDEYQDSSLTQEIILKSISKDFNNRFMVGDVKQSIYKFRQARPDIFLEKYNAYSTDLSEDSKKILLHKNFRSRKEILDATNYIFEHIMTPEIGGLHYGESERLNPGASFKEPSTPNLNHGGVVELHMINKDSSDDTSEELEEDLDKIQLEARLIANIIKKITSSNDERLYVIDKKTGEYRPVRYSDIVILLRSTTKWEEVVTNELESRGISVYSESSSNLLETFEIKSILAILKALNNVYDDIAMVGALRSPFFNIAIDEIINIKSSSKEMYIFDCLKEYANCYEDELADKCTKILNEIYYHIEFFKCNSIENSLMNLYENFNFPLFLKTLNNSSLRCRNLDIFLERAKEFEKTSNGDLSDFLTYLDNLTEYDVELQSASNSSNCTDAVRIMTIHRSKGLEFPVVFCAGLGKKFNNLDLQSTILNHSELGYGPQIIDFKKGITYPSIAKESIKSKMLIENLSEEMRVLYVALTRAKEKLYLVGSVNSAEKAITKWSNFTTQPNIIPKYAILKSNTYLDWIAPSVIKHPSSKEIRRTFDIQDVDISIHESKWSFRVWNHTELMEEKSTEEPLVNNSEPHDIGITETFESVVNDILKSNQEEDISINLPEKVTVTGILEDSTTQQLKIPKFIKSTTPKDLTGAERGSIIHDFFQKLDFKKVHSEDEIKQQLEVFIKNKFFTEDEGNVIPIHKIYKFFSSSLGQRMLKSKSIKKEREISSYLTLDKVTGVSKDANKEILVKGIIDIYFEEDDEIVLVDYKTDTTNKEDFDNILKKYKKQVILYKDILETITSKKVKEAYLYLLSSDKIIDVEF